MNCILMFYNVENLFSPTAHAPKNWTLQRHNDKLNNIIEVIHLAEKKYNSKPLFIGLCEIQEEQSIIDLLAHPYLSDYQYIYSESQDDRGMDTAVLYKTSEIDILQYHHFFVPTTRNILYCKIKWGLHILHTYTLHLPSKRNFDEHKHLRTYILEDLKKIIRQNLINSEEFVVILGDFNAHPNDDHLLKLMDIKEDYKLFNPFSQLYGLRRFSTFHQGRGLLFDQFIISENFLDNDKNLKLKQADIFSPNKIKKQGKPFRTFAGSRYLGGYSDHFPAILILENTEGQEVML